MSKKCKGCGVVLQNSEKDKIGYTPKIEADYCQRCFRIKHYDDVMISMKQGVDSDKVLQDLTKLDALFLWVVDLFDFEANIVKGMNRHLQGKDIILVACKRDLIPSSVGNEKIGQFILKRLKAHDIYVKGIVVCGDLVKNAQSKNNHSVEEIKHAISMYRNGRNVAVFGMANAGKSTLLNALLNKESLTTSRHPGTTLDLNEIPYEDYILYDTPGLTRYDSMLTLVDDSLLKQIIPTKELKPKQFQLKQDQSLAVAGLARLDLTGCENVSCVCYFSPMLSIHRGKKENANKLWSEHLGDEILSPTLNTNFTEMRVLESGKNEDKMDVVIHGLGWFTLSGKIKNIKVYVHKDVNVTFRGAMI